MKEQFLIGIAVIRMSRMCLFISILLFIASCTSQKVTSQVDTSPSVPKPERPSRDTVVEVQPDLPVGPDTFDIALVLPFYLDSVREIPDSAEVGFFEKSTLAIEFYNGVKTALDSLTSRGLNVRMHVYDDLNDKERIMKIAQLPAFQTLDLVLGPVYNNNLRQMAEFAKRDSVFMVSPLSPAPDITALNPYYIMVNPDIEVHCKRLFDYAVQRNFRNNILMFTRPGSEAEEEYAAVFRNLLNQYHASVNDTSFRLIEFPFTPKGVADDLTTRDESLTNVLDAYRKNIVIVPSVDKAYTYSVARTLNSFTEPVKDDEYAPEFDITVLGLPAWSEVQDFDYVHKLKVHFTSSSFIPPSFYSPENAFYKKYVDSFSAEPSEYAVKGFDLMMFFGDLLLKYGAPVDSMLLVERYNGIHTKFRFGEHLAETGAVSVDGIPVTPPTDFIENKYVHLLKYEDAEIKVVD